MFKTKMSEIETWEELQRDIDDVLKLDNNSDDEEDELVTAAKRKVDERGDVEGDVQIRKDEGTKKQMSLEEREKALVEDREILEQQKRKLVSEGNELLQNQYDEIQQLKEQNKALEDQIFDIKQEKDNISREKAILGKRMNDMENARFRSQQEREEEMAKLKEDLQFCQVERTTLQQRIQELERNESVMREQGALLEKNNWNLTEEAKQYVLIQDQQILELQKQVKQQTDEFNRELGVQLENERQKMKASFAQQLKQQVSRIETQKNQVFQKNMEYEAEIDKLTKEINKMKEDERKHLRSVEQDNQQKVIEIESKWRAENAELVEKFKEQEAISDIGARAIDDLERQIATLTTEIGNLRRNNGNDTVVNLQRELENANKKLESANRLAKEQEEIYESQRNELEARLRQEMERNTRSFRETIENLNVQVGNLEKERAELQNKIEELQESLLDSTRNDQVVAKLREEIATLRANDEGEDDAKERLIEQMEQDIAKLGVESRNLTKERDELRKQLESLRKNSSLVLQTEIEALKKDNENLQTLLLDNVNAQQDTEEDALARNDRRLEAEVGRLRINVNNLAKERDDLMDKVKRLQLQLDTQKGETERALGGKTNDSAMVRVQQELRKTREELSRKSAEIPQLQADLARIRSDKEASDRQMREQLVVANNNIVALKQSSGVSDEQLTKDYQQAKQKIANLERKVKELSAEKDKVAEALQTYKDNEWSKRGDVNKLLSENDRLQREVQRLTDEVNRLKQSASNRAPNNVQYETKQETTTSHVRPLWELMANPRDIRTKEELHRIKKHLRKTATDTDEHYRLLQVLREGEKAFKRNNINL